MKGILTIFIPMARGLTIADSMSNSSDPYVEIIFPDGKKVFNLLIINFRELLKPSKKHLILFGIIRTNIE